MVMPVSWMICSFSCSVGYGCEMCSGDIIHALRYSTVSLGRLLFLDDEDRLRLLEAGLDAALAGGDGERLLELLLFLRLASTTEEASATWGTVSVLAAVILGSMADCE